MHKVLGFLALLAVAGCASPPQPQVSYIHTCPVAPTYTKSFEQAAATQLQGLPAGSPLAQMTSDYLSVRNEIGVCQK